MTEHQSPIMRLQAYDREPASNEYVIIRDLMVPMRDGTKLATDVYLPANGTKAEEGPFPVILDRTPYDKVPRAPAGNDPEYFARRGYAFVFQDSRGHAASEGDFSIYLDEGRDGYDTVEWIAQQPWCNGDIATSGYSYDSGTQNALAREASPHLRAMFQAFGTANYRNDAAGHGGAFRLAHNLNYSLVHALKDRRARGDESTRKSIAEGIEHLAELLTLPASQHFRALRAVPMAESWYRDWLDHPDLDDYWKQNGYYFEGHYDEYPDIPSVFLGGYYDFLSLGTVVNFTGLRARKESPQYLILGPWCHGPLLARKRWQGAVDFGEASAVDWTPIRLAFFDQFLMGIETGLWGEESSVQVFVGGTGSGARNPNGKLDHGGYWITTSDWPPSETSILRLYLRSGGLLNTKPEQHVGASTTFMYDPDNPCPQVGGDYTFSFTRHDHDLMGPQDQIAGPDFPGSRDSLPLASRPDVVVFETEPLLEDVTVYGPMEVRLFVSTDAVDTDFTAKVIDQHPPSPDYGHGFALLLHDSIVRLRYRGGLEAPVFVEPGEIVEVLINLWMTGNRFKAGHRIRLDISSSSFPNYDPNPNTGEPIGYHTRTRVSLNTVYHDSNHQSVLMIPCLREDVLVLTGSDSDG